MSKKAAQTNTERNKPDALSADFDSVFLGCYQSLKSVVGRYLRHPVDVEDIVQETFVRTSEANQKSKILNLKAYFFTTARNLSLKHKALHANKITDYLEDLGVSEVLDNRHTLEEEGEIKEQFSLFCDALRELPPQCRRVLILKKVHGLPHAEIAKRLDITVSTSNQHLAKGLARCALYMREKGYFDETDALGNAKQLDEKTE